MGTCYTLDKGINVGNLNNAKQKPSTLVDLVEVYYVSPVFGNLNISIAHNVVSNGSESLMETNITYASIVLVLQLVNTVYLKVAVKYMPSI